MHQLREIELREQPKGVMVPPDAALLSTTLSLILQSTKLWPFLAETGLPPLRSLPSLPLSLRQQLQPLPSPIPAPL